MGRRGLFCLVIGLTAGVAVLQPGPTREFAGSRFLFVWAGDADKRESDFMAVVDVDPRSVSYASVVATLPVGATGTTPHHTEHEMPADGTLWANGFETGQTFRFDLSDPLEPRLVGAFGAVDRFNHPHSYTRLPSGNVLATFQHGTGVDGVQTGGLVEFDAQGRAIRHASAAVPNSDPGVRPYSLAVVPALNRIVTTSTDMHLKARSTAVQIWRLSDLELLQTILLPPGSRGDENAMTAEPRLLADGRTVLVNTFTCGLYRLQGLVGGTVTAEWVYSTPWKEPPFCALPVVTRRFWVQTSGPEHAVITLDISDPGRPHEVARLTLPPGEVPHWISLEPNGNRVVITGYKELESRVLLADFDQSTGVLRLDADFRSPGVQRPGVDFGREQWPHGSTGRAIPHGAVFSRP